MKAKVYVELKSGVHDPQGQAVGRTLGKLGYQGVNGVRIGKYIEIELAGDDVDDATKKVEAMCKELLVNTVMENFRFEIE